MISESPTVYVDVDNFVIDRSNIDDIHRFIDDMTNQISEVKKMMDKEQKSVSKEWTELNYELNEERKAIAQTAIDEAMKLMPYVLTFNDNIGNCSIIDYTRENFVLYSKTDKVCNTDGLKCKRILISKNDGEPVPFDCYYLELHEGKSRVILPLKDEKTVYSLNNIPRLFVHFPLIGTNNFGVNFLFHSHLFTPEEPRDNIIVPRENDATDKAAAQNKVVLDDMTKALWTFLEANVHMWSNTIKMASINIQDRGYEDAKTGAYYKELKELWVAEFSKLKLMDINGDHYSMEEDGHPVVLEPTLESFISREVESDYLSVIYPYANGVRLIPCKEELLQWSRIIAGWNVEVEDNFLSLATIIEYVSQHQGDHLYDVLKMIVKAGCSDFFDKYALLPNREGNLKKRGDLRNAKPVTGVLYGYVKDINAEICTKMVDERYADIVELTPYTRQQLREELNSTIKKKEEEYWKTCKKAYDGFFEKSLIALCSTFPNANGESKRNKLMPIICRFEGIDYEERVIPTWEEDPAGFDLYRQIFLSLVENQMMKIDQYDKKWVENHMYDLVAFVDNARGDDYKNFCTRYSIYPDMTGILHVPDELKKNNNVNTELFTFYYQVIGEDLREKCVDTRFERFYDKYAEEANQYTPKSVAKEIQNKLSADNYQDTVVLDIIDLAEVETDDGYMWRMLFKDIYDQRESIRYNLGTDTERRAINRMLKQKNPDLLKKMADVSEREDAMVVLDSVEDVLRQRERDRYLDMLGAYVEKHIQKYLTESLKEIGVTIDNVQDGQDFILSKNGYSNYYVEVKSRWENDQTIEMTAAQMECATSNPNAYAVISVNMYHYDRTKVENNELMPLSDVYSNIKVLDNIGELESDLFNRTKEAFKWTPEDIRLNGSYKVMVPQKAFNSYPLDFNGLIERLKRRFSL